MEGPGNIHHLPLTRVPSANDNAEQRKHSTVLDRTRESEIQAVFTRDREEHPERWKEYKLDEYRQRLSIVHDEVLIERFNAEDPRMWEVDPRYFYILLERVNRPANPEN